MKNVYDMLVDRNLIHIISDTQINYRLSNVVYIDTAIVVNLFYEDTLNQYFTYLDNIPKSIEVYIYSSNEKAWEDIVLYADKRDNVFFLKKENRGRDISTFLVAFREIALKKKFLCFLHDKKEKDSQYKEDTNFWIKNLWGNTVCSETYIKNVLGMLNEREIGILTPPIPFGDRFSYWYTNQWSEEDLVLTFNLADKLGLKCNIDSNKMPITLGSVFWCKTEAIRKILEYSWKYDDFPDEPMPSDGTISHAIERIFAYIAQDAGYTTEWIMCSQYASSLILKSQCQMIETYHLLKKNFIADSLVELRKFDGQRKKIEGFCSECNKVYLYGAGVEGQKFANWMHFWNLKVDGFIVTKQSTNQKMILGIPIYEFGEVETDKTVGIIIVVSSKFSDEIEKIVKRRGDIRYCKPIQEVIRE